LALIKKDDFFLLKKKDMGKLETQGCGTTVLVEKSRTLVPTGPGVHSQQGSMALLDSNANSKESEKNLFPSK